MIMDNFCIVLFFKRNEFTALGRVVSFEACCQWALLSVCKSLDTTLLFKSTVQLYSYPSVSKMHAGSFCVFVIHQTLTWTTGSSMCVRDHSFACVYTPTVSQHNIFNSEKLVPLMGFDLGSLMSFCSLGEVKQKGTNTVKNNPLPAVPSAVPFPSVC